MSNVTKPIILNDTGVRIAEAIEALEPSPEQINESVTDWLEENISNPDSPPLDRSLQSSSAASPADLVGEIKEDVDALKAVQPYVFSSEMKIALLNCFSHVAWTDENGETYYNALSGALLDTVASITAVFNQGANTIWSDDTLDSIKQYLTVTALNKDGTTETVENYTLSGNLNSASSTITVTYANKTTTFTASVRVVGSTNYFPPIGTLGTGLNQWRGSDAGVAAYSNGEIVFSGVTSSMVEAYSAWIACGSKTLWSEVAGKTLRIRLTEYSNNWSGDYSDANCILESPGIFISKTDNKTNQRICGLALDRHILSSSQTVYEYILDLSDITSWTYYSGRTAEDITANSSFGWALFDRTLNDVRIVAAECVEVLN